MNTRRLDLMLLAFAAVMLLLTAQRWRRAVPAHDLPVAALPAIPRVPSPLPDDTAADAVDATVDNDPFRISNHPPAVRLVSKPGELANAGPPSIRPALRLKAIVGGPPWQAILDGIPGQTGSVVVAAGMVLGALRVRVVTSDTVIVQAADTTWHLTLARTGP